MGKLVFRGWSTHPYLTGEQAWAAGCRAGVYLLRDNALSPHFNNDLRLAMKPTLQPGIRYEHRFVVPPSKLVPALYPEAEEFNAMPEVFATGFLVGFLEWACIRAINPHLDWPREQTVGTHIDVSHEAATPPGLEVTATVTLVATEGKKLIFEVEAHDGIDLIAKGRHERFVIDREKFDARLAKKRAPAA